jgi:bifunctional ADP-heptose synthase (sugar kinase/adenylyltransferase)
MEPIQSAVEELNLRHWVVTHGEQGIDIYSSGKKGIIHIEGVPVHMVDVCGAGDTVTAILGVCSVYDMDIKTSCELSNFMAAESCKHIGVYTINHEDLLKYDNRD